MTFHLKSLRVWQKAFLRIVILVLVFSMGLTSIGLCSESFEEFIIGYSSEDALQEFLEENNLERAGGVGKLGLVYVRSESLSAMSFLMDSAESYQGVLFVEPDYQITLEPLSNIPLKVVGVDSVFPDDPFWSDDPLTGLGQWNMRKIGADDAWELVASEGIVIVSVIDTGVFYPHRDLSSRYMGGGYDWVNGDDDPIDDNGHGSWVAGVISAERGNGYGVTGISSARIIAEKVLNQYGQGSISDVVSAIIHSADLGADVLSLSLGTYHHSTSLELAVNYAYDNGCVLVASAGNDKVTRSRYPAAYSNVLAVSATFGEPERLSWYSNYGPWVDLCAPGGQDYDGNHLPDIGEYWVLSCSDSVDGYMYGTGTSASAPHVSGVAALLKGVNPLLTNEGIIDILRESAEDLGDPGWDQYYGDGRVDAFDALELGMMRSVGGDARLIGSDLSSRRSHSLLLAVTLPMLVLQIILYFHMRNKMRLKRT